MSIPTGHQVMHRPHPTQPELSNWSYQVDNLWVIHWRYRDSVDLRTGEPWSSENRS